MLTSISSNSGIFVMHSEALFGTEPVSIIVPAYNEERALAEVIEELRQDFIRATGRSAENTEIVVVNDGSRDKTGAVADQLGVRVIHHPTNFGYGAAVKTALRAASHNIIVMTDADNTYPARYIQPLLEQLQNCDMAVGSRSGKVVHIPTIRKPAKWVLKTIAVYLAQKPIDDLNSGLRAFRRADAMKFMNLYPSGFSFTTTITLAYLSSDMLVRYIPIDYNARTGHSKIRPIRDTKNLFLTIIRSILFFNPLRVCIPFAFVLVLAAMLVLFLARDEHGNILDGTILALMICAVQVTIMGFLADVIARMRT